MKLVPALAAAAALAVTGRWLSRLILSTSVIAFSDHLDALPEF